MKPGKTRVRTPQPQKRPPPPRPAASEAELAALEDAGRWLDEATIAHIPAYALGEERSYDFDQAAGRLRLNHADEASIDFEAQIIASFDPGDGSFRWSWANPSVRSEMSAAAAVARDHPDTKDFPSFQEEVFGAPFDEARKLAALAARLGGFDGVYRCLSDGALTVFAGYKAPDIDRRAWFGSDAPSGDQEAAAIELIERWDAEMFPVDEAYKRQDKKDDPDHSIELMDRLLSEKNAIYERYWKRDDDYWRPSSFRWPSEHDPSQLVRRIAAPRRQGGLYVIRQMSRREQTAHVVEWFDDAPRITEIDIEWGSGVLLS